MCGDRKWTAGSGVLEWAIRWDARKVMKKMESQKRKNARISGI